MNFKIFWFPLLLLLKLSIGVFTYSIYRTIKTERANLGKPIWVLSRAGDRMPNKNYSKPPLFESFDEIQPFINWNGVVKMVVPTNRIDTMSDPDEFYTEVYDWDALPSFVNDDGELPSCTCCDGGGTPESDKLDYYVNKLLRFSLTISPGIIMFIILLLVIFVIISTCSRCHHKSYCQNLQEDETSSSSASCYEYIEGIETFETSDG